MRSIRQLRAAINRAAGGSLTDDQIDKIIKVFLRVIRNDLMGLHEIATRLNIAVAAAGMRVWRQGLPKHAGRMASGRYWTRWDIETYIKQNPKAVRQTKDEVMTDAG